MPSTSKLSVVISMLLHAGLVWLVLAARVDAQPKPADAAKKAEGDPPWKHVLTGEDAKKVEELEKKIEELRQAGKYVEGQAAARTILEIRSRVQGTEHWQTGDAKRLLRTLQQIAALPANAKAELAQADKLDGEISKLFQQGRYADALPLLSRALELRRRHLGEEHSEVAVAMNELAFALKRLGRYTDAEPLYQGALAFFRRVLGEEHPHTADSYNNLAMSLQAQGKYAQAEPLLQTALALRRKVLGEEHVSTAESYDNVAGNLHQQGKYAEAGLLHQKALALFRKVLGEAHAYTAESYDNVARNLHEQGKYAEAEPLHQKALALFRKVVGEEHPDTAICYGNLAGNLRDQGRYAEAEPLFRQALALFRKVLGEEHPYTAATYDNLSSNLRDQGKYAEAQAMGQKSLAIRRKVLGEEHAYTGASYSTLASNLHDQGKYAEAEPLFRQALAVFRKALGEQHPRTAQGYNNLAFNLNCQGRYAEAEALWISAARSFDVARLRSNVAGLQRASFATQRSPLPALTACLARAGKATQAWHYLEAGLARGLLDDVSGNLTRSLTEDERKHQQRLIAKLDQLGKEVASLVTAKEKTEASRAKLEELIKQRQTLETQLAQFEARLAEREVYDLKRVQEQLPADAALVAWVDIKGQIKAADPNGEHWACALRHKGQPLWVKLPGSGPQKAWTKDDDDLPDRLRRTLGNRPGEERWQVITRQLAEQRLVPLEPYLRADGDLPAVKHLLVAAVWSMAGVPVEALTDRYTISYVPSGTMFAKLQEKPRQGQAKDSAAARLLALGDPVFLQPETPTIAEAKPPDHGVLIRHVIADGNAAKSGLKGGDVLLSYTGKKLSGVADLTDALRQKPDVKPAAQSNENTGLAVQVWRAGKTLALTVGPGPLGIVPDPHPAGEVILAQRDGDRAVRASRGHFYDRLPGTGREVEAIAQLFDKPVKLLRSEASEQRLDQLGDLRQFRYLHLATHGDLDNRIAMHSALILSEDNLPDPVEQYLAGKTIYDGRLTAEKILKRWKLDADLVTLSACQTGLGQKAGGEGYLGFAQVLFLAGARSVVLSLWKVDDTATALLMTRFYQNLLGKRQGLKQPMPRAQAMTEAKRWLRGLSADQVERVSAELARGLPRVKGPPRQTVNAARPYDHPYYWSAFILIGDPD